MREHVAGAQGTDCDRDKCTQRQPRAQPRGTRSHSDGRHTHTCYVPGTGPGSGAEQWTEETRL